MTNRQHFWFMLIAAACIALIVVMFLNNKKEEHTPAAYHVNYSPDYAVSGNVTGLVANSDYVVSGRYEKFIENWDMGENHYSEIYSFVVDEALLGNVKGTIHVSIPHTVLLKKIVDTEEYEARFYLPNYSKPDLNKTYVLFLKKAQTREVFGPSSVPFQAEIDSEGTVALKANTIKQENIITTKQSDIISFQSEQIELEAIDEITGLTKEVFFEEIKKQAIEKLEME
jgi:hypothetical protein